MPDNLQPKRPRWVAIFFWICVAAVMLIAALHLSGRGLHHLHNV